MKRLVADQASRSEEQVCLSLLSCCRMHISDGNIDSNSPMEVIIFDPVQSAVKYRPSVRILILN